MVIGVNFSFEKKKKVRERKGDYRAILATLVTLRREPAPTVL